MGTDNRGTMSETTSLMVNHIDRGTRPDPDDSRFLLEVDNEGHADIVFVDTLAFHAERLGEDWAVVSDKNGYLTSKAGEWIASALAAMLRERAGIESPDVAYAEGLEYDDEPSYALSIRTRYSDGETFESWLDRVGWPVIATVTNASDPGTFNHPYLFTGTPKGEER